jgi:hypothetical protein
VFCSTPDRAGLLASERVPQRHLRGGLLCRADRETLELQHYGGEQMLTRIRALVRRVAAWRRRRARPGTDPLLASDAERARARAAADYHKRVGDPGHTGGM